MGALQLLGQALRIPRRHQQAVHPVADDIAVAGDVGGNHRRAGGEGLGQHHAEALARERGRAEHVGAVQLSPEAVAGDATADVDRAQQLGVGEVTQHVLALGPDHRQPAGHVLDQGTKGSQQNRQALALLRAADEEDAQLARRGRRRARRCVDVDPVGNDRVVAAIPAAPGPGGRLGDGDPGREAVEHAASTEAVGDVVGHRLGRVGVKGADDRGPRSQSRVPAGQRRQRLVDVDDVEVLAAHLPSGRQHPTAWEWRQIAHGSVDSKAHRAPQRRQVIRQIPRFRRRSVQDPADPARRVIGGKHANVVATAEELLSKRLHMPIHAPLIRPGIWRDESYAHE